MLRSATLPHGWAAEPTGTSIACVGENGVGECSEVCGLWAGQRAVQRQAKARYVFPSESIISGHTPRGRDGGGRAADEGQCFQTPKRSRPALAEATGKGHDSAARVVLVAFFALGRGKHIGRRAVVGGTCEPKFRAP